MSIGSTRGGFEAAEEQQPSARVAAVGAAGGPGGAPTHRSGGWTVLAATGTLEAGTAGPVRQALRRLTDAEVGHILVDLSGITWMDAVGAGVLIGAYRRSCAYQGEFRLVVPSWAIRNLLKVTGLIEFVPVYQSIEAAEADLAR